MERYIICFGKNEYPKPNKIVVYDVKMKTFSASSIDCPFRSAFSAIIVGCDEFRKELMVFGFINQCFDSAEYANIQRLPFYLIQFIALWVSNDEWIHVISRQNVRHWKIHADTILNNM